jgi:hypothetical protein
MIIFLFKIFSFYPHQNYEFFLNKKDSRQRKRGMSSSERVVGDGVVGPLNALIIPRSHTPSSSLPISSNLFSFHTIPVLSFAGETTFARLPRSHDVEGYDIAIVRPSLSLSLSLSLSSHRHTLSPLSPSSLSLCSSFLLSFFPSLSLSLNPSSLPPSASL